MFIIVDSFNINNVYVSTKLLFYTNLSLRITIRTKKKLFELVERFFKF